MPYPNEHSCRLADPGQFDRFARQMCGQKHNGKCIDVILGIKAGKSQVQALRYMKDMWTEAAARDHCATRDGAFEAASEAQLPPDIERRAFPAAELRIDGIGDQGKQPLIRGYAAIFEALSEDLGGFREKVAKGAFGASLQARDDVRALWNHNPDYVLGRTKSGTLRLAEDDKGLVIEIDPPDTQWGRDLLVSIDRGDVSEMSFGFRTIKDSWVNQGGTNPERTLIEVKLFDVSPVTFPAYAFTSVKVRDHLKAMELASASVSETGRVQALIVDRWNLRK